MQIDERDREWVGVDTISYRKYSKPGKPSALELTYQCGKSRYREWVCLEHENESYPRQLAERWWKRHSDDPAPSTVEAALALTDTFRKPKSICVKLHASPSANGQIFLFPADHKF